MAMNRATAMTRPVGAHAETFSPANKTGARPAFYRLTTSVDDDGGERISVFGVDHAEICGAFSPAGQPHWLIYVTNSVIAAAGDSDPGWFPPHLQLRTRRHAYQWLELIARLYVRGVSVSAPGQHLRT
jgi:hypothetical protein